MSFYYTYMASRDVSLLQQVLSPEQELLCYSKLPQLINQNADSLLQSNITLVSPSLSLSLGLCLSSLTFGVNLESPVESPTNSIGTELKQRLVIILQVEVYH